MWEVSQTGVQLKIQQFCNDVGRNVQLCHLQEQHTLYLLLSAPSGKGVQSELGIAVSERVLHEPRAQWGMSQDITPDPLGAPRRPGTHVCFFRHSGVLSSHFLSSFFLFLS